MSYQVFARKYRPRTFDDILGQDHVVTTLRNAIEGERLAHAYLFVGPRGTGKTSHDFPEDTQLHYART